MADLTGTTPANTYKGLLQVNDYTDGVDATAKYIQDGEGTDSALAISTDNVGIGTTSPTLTTPPSHAAGPMFGLRNSLSAGMSLFRDDTTIVSANAIGGIFFYGNGSTDPASPVSAQELASIECFAGEAHDDNAHGSTLNFHTNNGTTLTERMTIDKDGNVGIGATYFGATAAGVLAIQNGTAPTSSPADMVQLYAKDDAGSSRLYVRNEAGTETVLSPHAADAPSSLYDRPPGVEEMHRSANYYLGTIVFTNVDRRNDLLQKQLNGEELPVDRTFTVTETFAEYNTRTGADLQVEDWDANQQAMADADESYVKKPKPEWLS